MIRHHVQKDPDAAKRYYKTADYYTAETSFQSEFGGRGAERLGIAGPAEYEHFERLCDNLHPLTGEKLTPRTKDGRIVGIDLTFDGPKSVAVIEAFAPEEERRRLREARVAAELETMAELEREAATRVRACHRDENRTTGELLWFRASHDTARPVDGVPDMQPHEHYFILNATWDAVESKWKAVNLVDIIPNLPYYQAAFHDRLATRLQAMGYEIDRKGNAFEVVGIPQKVIDKYSRRTKQVEELAAKLGITDPDRKGELGAQSREHKSDKFTPDQLRRIWRSWLTPADAEAITDTHLSARRREADGVEPWRGVTPKEAFAHAAAHVFERRSSAPARQLVAEALVYGVGGFTVEEAWAELDKDGRFTADVDGERMVASRQVLAEEQTLIRTAASGRNTLAPINAGHVIEDRRLNIPQRAAVHHLLGSRSAVTMVIGAAGTGKTTLLNEARRGAAAAGVNIVAVAPSADASRINLRSEGFPEAETVQALLVSKRLQEKARGQVILVDEAAMLGTRQAAELLDLAGRLGARLWLVGDDKQNPSVNRGSPFELLQARAGVTPAIVTETQRHEDPKYKQLAELARGDTAAAFARMRDLGWVVEVDDAERYQRLAADYVEATKPQRRQVGGKWKEGEPTALVLCPTHSEGAKVQAAVRELLKAEGRLGEEREFLRLTPLQLTEAQRADPHSYQPGDVIQFTQNATGHARGERVELSGGVPPPAHLAARFQAYRPGTIKVAAGDRLRVTAGGQTRDGHRLNTGELLTVAGFTKSGDLLDHRGWVIPKDYGHLSGGYAATTRGGQGRTVDRVLIALGTESRGGINRAEFYTDLTRAREWARVYTDNAKSVAHAVTREEPRISATELADRRRLQRRSHERLTARVLARARRATYDRPVDRELAPALERETVNER